MDIVCDDNLAALIKSGFPPEEVVHDAWADIQMQCSEVVGNSEYIIYTRTFREIADLRTQITLITTAVHMLGISYHKGFAIELNKLLHTNFDFSKDNRIELLQRCMRRSMSVKMNLQVKIEHFKSMQKTVEQGKKPDRNYFLGNLISLSDHAGYQVQDNISVFEYYERIKRLNKYCETLKSKHHGRRSY